MQQSNIAGLQDSRYTTGMGEALGAYLKTLRMGRKLKSNEVLRQLGERLRLDRPVDQTRLWRAESGKGWPEGDFLVALMDIIGADLNDVAWIQQHPNASAAEGRERAQVVLSKGTYTRAVHIAEQIPDVDVAIALGFVRV